MQRYEYKVVPAPRRGEKLKGVKTVEDRFAVALARVMNDLAADGWEYQRADTLPCEERVGLTGKATHFHHMLVFRRSLGALAGVPASMPAAAAAPVLMAEPPAGPAPALPPATAAVQGVSPAVGPAVGPLVPPQASTRPAEGG